MSSGSSGCHVIVEIDGENIRTERDFHDQIAKKLEFGPYYGCNLDALWDRLSTDVERPLRLIWCKSEASRDALGERFGGIVEVLRRVAALGRELGWVDRFEFELA